MPKHRWIDGKCECGCELNFHNLKGKGKRRTYSFDGFKTYTAIAPPCTRAVALMTKAEKMVIYREVNKASISEYFKQRYKDKKMEMFKKVVGV